MCDTLVALDSGSVWLAKNSDREPAEPQVVQRLPAVAGDDAADVACRHVRIAQVPDRRGALRCRPVWCWGAEMGVNDAGVAIGNEAIFSRRRERRPGLLGMDLLRLGLERAGSADEALYTITSLLESHGQGGPAGYRDRSFCYDNSFLIADAAGAWHLETAGRDWVARRVQRACAISNRLRIRSDWHRASKDIVKGTDFAQRFDGMLMPRLARAASRQAAGDAALEQPPGFATLAAHLRHHASGEDPARGRNADVCMHARGFIRRHQTTNSLIARLDADGARVVVTGTSAPCLSIFRPVALSGPWSALTPADKLEAAPLWHAHESVHRRALADRDLRQRLRATRDAIEQRIFTAMSDDQAARQKADRLAASWGLVMLREAAQSPARLPRFWRRQPHSG